MSVYIVTYDLKSPGRNYQPIYDYLKRFKNCHGLESVWLIDTAIDSSQIRDDLQKLVDSNDVIFVVELKQHWASLRFTCSAWLKDTTRSW